MMEGNRVGPFEILDLCLDDLDRSKPTEVIATDVGAAVVTAPRDSAPLNDYSIDSEAWNTPTSNIRGPQSNVKYAVDIPYEEKPHDLGFFVWGLPYRI